MTFVLGLTGSIGMGKSTTAAMFAELGVPVHDADAAVHRLYRGARRAAGRGGVSGHGRATASSTARRSASAVLGDPTRLQRLEAIVHPLVRAERERFPAPPSRRRRAAGRARHPAAVRDRRRATLRCGRRRHGARRGAARARAGRARA